MSSSSDPLFSSPAFSGRRFQIFSIILVALATFGLGIISPPHLMDDVDGTQGQIVRNMIKSGDWVTGHLDGVIFLDKAPFKYWLTIPLYHLFGAHDWVARIPNALTIVLLALAVYGIGRWAGAPKAGYYAALVLSTSIGLFLFTRIVIPDVILTFAITMALWSFLRVVEEESPKPVWAYSFYAFTAVSVLIKGLIGLVFPVGIALVYLLLTHNLFNRAVWKRLRLVTGLLVFLAIALPWHILAILRNPPYFDWTIHAGDHFGYKFRGFFWFYFINDQLLRFTNNRWPHDYNTVPRMWFWLYHLIWFFPWSAYLFGIRKRMFQGGDRLARLHLLCLIWIGVIMVFFTMSTTQEYYSMPIYPALALLMGSVMASDWPGARMASRIVGVVTGLAFAACTFLLINAWNLPTPGDISDALSNNPDVYTLSLGHMADLTFGAFAYLRTPLAIAALAFLIGTISLWVSRRAPRYAGTVLMLVLFFQAARLALVAFDPYLSSYPEAEALNKLPKGTLIFNGQYYDFSAIPFYTDYNPLLLNGRYFNLEYGSYAPDAAPVFIDNQQFVDIWNRPQTAYVVSYEEKRGELEKLVGKSRLHLVMHSGGKELFSNAETR